MSVNDIKIAILELLTSNKFSSDGVGVMAIHYEAKMNKYNLIGRKGAGRGAIEGKLDVYFTNQERLLASKAFDQLVADGYIEPTLDDLVDPENWVVITELGIDKLKRGFTDYIDECLQKIGSHLVEMRQGMWDAVKRNSPDSCRQAAHSARDLIDQVLKIATNDPAVKERKQRARIVMGKFRGKVSKSDVNIIDAHFDVIDGEHQKLINYSHSRDKVQQKEVEQSLQSAERILTLLFGNGNNS